MELTGDRQSEPRTIDIGRLALRTIKGVEDTFTFQERDAGTAIRD